MARVAFGQNGSSSPLAFAKIVPQEMGSIQGDGEWVDILTLEFTTPAETDTIMVIGQLSAQIDGGAGNVFGAVNLVVDGQVSDIFLTFTQLTYDFFTLIEFFGDLTPGETHTITLRGNCSINEDFVAMAWNQPSLQAFAFKSL